MAALRQGRYTACMATKDTLERPTKARMLEAFNFHVLACRGMEAPLAAALIEAARDDIERDGPVADLLADFEGDPLPSALALRLLAGLHRLVLTDRAPELAAHCATVGGSLGNPHEAGALGIELVKGFADELRPQLLVDPQTNEVARSGALFGGLQTIWKRTNLPMRLFELGASAGLNLRFDAYRYKLGIFEWGDPDSPVLIEPRWLGDFLRPAKPFEILSREGCDVAPIDVHDEEQVLRLRSYVWPDERDRYDRLRSAIELVRAQPVTVTRDDAVDFLADKLAETTLGVTTVVYHSIFWDYMSASDRKEVEAIFEEAAIRSRVSSPLAWLRLEPQDHRFQLRLRLWPKGGGRDELLAEAHPHCRWVHWKAAGMRPMLEEIDDG